MKKYLKKKPFESKVARLLIHLAEAKRLHIWV